MCKLFDLLTFPCAHLQIAKSILELSLRELFDYRLMQTDPNWSNFLYNERTGKIELIDFGAAREYDKPFIDDWLCILRAAIGGRREECAAWSEKVGYLTGNESEVSTSSCLVSQLQANEYVLYLAGDAKRSRRLNDRAGRTISGRRTKSVSLCPTDDHGARARTHSAHAARASHTAARADVLAQSQAQRRIPALHASWRRD